MNFTVPSQKCTNQIRDALYHISISPTLRITIGFLQSLEVALQEQRATDRNSLLFPDVLIPGEPEGSHIYTRCDAPESITIARGQFLWYETPENPDRAIKREIVKTLFSLFGQNHSVLSENAYHPIARNQVITFHEGKRALSIHVAKDIYQILSEGDTFDLDIMPYSAQEYRFSRQGSAIRVRIQTEADVIKLHLGKGIGFVLRPDIYTKGRYQVWPCGFKKEDVAEIIIYILYMIQQIQK